ncbi:helix-turn-helix domain-containing protein [Epibacterium ulvae]|uniref:helix-turn-helix domain-containing protein n=1 Tax=Epibacterium ulvae TaxID=1156985 RepID=UPI001BFC8B55|nr:helix-turn-helix domain-containing protein [Epibacterium ulvae]MBT8155767.1 helix-turn-helix domain-containing protein [Epibacterium ulvae]
MLNARNASIYKTGPGFDSWHQSTCRDFSTTECESINNPEFRGSVHSWKSGSIGLGDITANSRDSDMPLIRRASDIRRDPRDHIMICTVKHGNIDLTQAERSVRIKPGDVVLYDQSKPFGMNFVGNVRGLVAAFPRSHVTSRLSRVEKLTARKVPVNSQAGKFTRLILDQLQPDDGSLDNTLSKNVEASALDLIFGSIDHVFSSEDFSEKAHKEKQLYDIQRFMKKNLADADLNIDLICANHGISARSLNRLFSAEGTTPMRWLWQARLEGAHRDILKNQHASITNIAFDFGFSDPSHFSKAFKRSFGVAPSSLQKSLGYCGTAASLENSFSLPRSIQTTC